MILSTRQKAFFLIALKYRGYHARNLLRFFSQEEARDLEGFFEKTSQSKSSDLSDFASLELKKLLRTREGNYLNDVHDDWVAEMLKNESPSMISTILRYLPAERVSSILDALPREILRNFPTLGATFETKPALVEALRRRFESCFEIEKTFDPKADFQFESLCFLHTDQIDKIFFELGYREIAFGLVSLPKKTRDMVLGRLLPEDRARVEYCLKTASKVSQQRMRRAQIHVISKEIDPRRPKFFVKELGFLIYSKAMLPKDQEDFEILKKKFSFQEAIVFQRLVERNLPKNTDASVLPYREDIVSTVRAIRG